MANPQPNTAKPAQMPRYKVLAICHINDRLLDPNTMPLDLTAEVEDGFDAPLKPLIISYAGIPGPHLEPVNDAAREMCEKHRDRMVAYNPVADLPVAGANVSQADVTARAIVGALKEAGMLKAA